MGDAFSAIILLAEPFEQCVLSSILRQQSPQLTVLGVSTLADLVSIDHDVLSSARLIAFVSPIIVPPGVLDRLGYGAYNFHPGPPEFPGWAPAQFAIYRGVTEFGATVHQMV